MIDWESVSKFDQATVEEIEDFDARGMRRLFGRGDNFGRNRNFQMDIWVSRDQRMLMRCWSRCIDIDWCSFEIMGMVVAEIPHPAKNKVLDDSWVPEVARKAYSEWIKGDL